MAKIKVPRDRLILNLYDLAVWIIEHYPLVSNEYILSLRVKLKGGMVIDYEGATSLENPRRIGCGALYRYMKDCEIRLEDVPEIHASSRKFEKYYLRRSAAYDLS